MNWGSLISTLLPTIGNVVSGLLGADSIEDGVMSFYHNNVAGAQEDFSSVFYKENGEYFLFNQSSSQDDIIAMTFPARGNIGAETVLLPGRQSFNVTSIFQENGQKDNCQFELSAGTTAQPSNGTQAQNSGIKISSSGKAIPVGGEAKPIGSFLDVQACQDQIKVLPKNGIVINSLPIVTVHSGGENSMSIIDAIGDGDSAIVTLPQPLLENDLISVDVVANVSNQSLSHMLEYQSKTWPLTTVKDDTADRIKNAPKLNWR